MLTKNPEDLKSCVFPVKYFSAAREAFSEILASLEFSSDKKLLLPAYIGITDREGSGVYDPVQENSTPHDFYSLDERLGAIEVELFDLIESGQYRALLIIHYFGFCQNRMDKIVELCKRNGVLLIEDCAHTMLSSVDMGNLGHLGDFSFYSIHKYLAAKDGGCLRVNNHQYLSNLQRSDRSIRTPSTETLNVILESNLEAIKARRRENYLHLSELLRPLEGIELMYDELPLGISPHNLPLIVNEGRREEIYFKLIEVGVPAIALYYRMIPPIAAGGFPNALKVSASILNLPVHQDVATSELDFVAEKFEAALLS